MTPTRVVLDTNCLVSALIFSHGRAGQLRIAWQRGDIIPVVCRESVAELLRVLGYPKFKLRHEDIKNLLADVLPWAETLELNSCDDNIEFLRDRDDAVFIWPGRRILLIWSQVTGTCLSCVAFFLNCISFRLQNLWKASISMCRIFNY